MAQKRNKKPALVRTLQNGLHKIVEIYLPSVGALFLKKDAAACTE